MKISGVRVVSLLVAIMTDSALVCLVLVGNASVWTGVIFGLRAKVIACPRLLNWILVVIGSRAIFALAKKPIQVLVLVRVSRFAFIRRCWCFRELFKDAILRNLIVRQGLIFGN